MPLFISEDDYVQTDYVADSYVYNIPPVTRNGFLGTPTSYDVSSSKTAIVYTKDYMGRVTTNSALGISRALYGTSTRIVEGRDSVFALESNSRSGDVDVTESGDGVDAEGLVSTTGSYSNKWFNSTWFNPLWFNSTWFNSVVDYTASADITETGDTTAGNGHVFISATADITETDDVLTTYGSTGNAVAGDADITETRDGSSIQARLIVTGTLDVIETGDTVTTDGSLSTLSLRLSWEQIGGMTGVDIYRSTDNVNFIKIASVGGAVYSYIDTPSDLSVDYYYYLVGTTTTEAATDPSSTVFMDLPTN